MSFKKQKRAFKNLDRKRSNCMRNHNNEMIFKPISYYLYENNTLSTLGRILKSPDIHDCKNYNIFKDTIVKNRVLSSKLVKAGANKGLQDRSVHILDFITSLTIKEGIRWMRRI